MEDFMSLFTNPNRSVRILQPKDAGTLSEIYNANLGPLHGVEIPVEEWQHMLEENDPYEAYFFITEKGVPRAWLKLNGLENPDNGYISMLAVLPAYQRRGLGTFAIRFAEGYMRSKGIGQLRVHTTLDNLPALNLYGKLGFVENARRSIIAENGDGVMLVRLVKTL